MFATQLSGVFNRIQDKQLDYIEDGARLLAQALVGDGTLYIYGFKEMAAITVEACEGQEPLIQTVPWNIEDPVENIKEMDRFLLITRSSTDSEAIELAKSLSSHFVPFVAISTHIDSDAETLLDFADVHIDLQLTKALLPNDEGGRTGYPSSIIALFVYFGLKFTVEEILAEYE
jgi:hypothetical protein